MESRHPEDPQQRSAPHVALLRIRVLVLAAVAATLIGAVPAAAGTLDQGNSILGTRADSVNAVFERAQTFTAGTNGVVGRLDLVVYRSSYFSAPLSVAIHAVNAGIPSTGSLGTTTVSADVIPVAFPGQQWVEIPLRNAVPVVAGTQYAIVLSSAAEPSTGYAWMDGTAYSGGTGFTSENGGAWYPSGFNYDPSFVYAFRTYVSPPATVEFLQPLDQTTDSNNSVINTGSRKRVVPVKVRITQNGAPVTDTNASGPVTIDISGPTDCTNATTDAVESYADAGQSNGDTNEFRYDAPAEAWIYNLDPKVTAISPATTPGLTIGQCYRIDVSLDGTTLTNAFVVYKPVR